MSDPNDWLAANAGGSGYPSMKFKDVGDYVAGTIDGTPRVVDGTNLDGEPERSLVIDLKVSKAKGVVSLGDGVEGDAAEQDYVSIWLKKGSMARAAQSAITTAGARGLEDGGTFALVHSELGEQKKAGWNKPKLYTAEYKSPTPAVPVGAGLLD
jgi:hypothetical protein